MSKPLRTPAAAIVASGRSTLALLVSYHRDSRLLISLKRICNQITARIAFGKFILQVHEHAFDRRCRCNKLCAAASAFV